MTGPISRSHYFSLDALEKDLEKWHTRSWIARAVLATKAGGGRAVDRPSGPVVPHMMPLIDEMTLFLLDLRDASKTTEALQERFKPLVEALAPYGAITGDPRQLLRLYTPEGSLFLEALIEGMAEGRPVNMMPVKGEMAPLFEDRVSLEAALYESNARQFLLSYRFQGSTYFKELHKIPDRRFHQEIALMAMESHVQQVSQHIKDYEITDPAALLMLAKKAAAAPLIAQGNRLWSISEDIKNYGIKDLESLKEIALLEAKKSGWLLSRHIGKYGITDEESLIAIAKEAARHGLDSSQMGNFGIKDQKALTEIAKMTASHGIINIGYFGLRDQENLIEVAKVAVKYNPQAFSRSVEEYGIEDQAVRIVLAKDVAAEGVLSAHIKDFAITDQKALVELAKIEATKSGLGVAGFIEDYGIDDMEALAEIARIAARQSGRMWEFIDYFGLSDEIKKEIEYICVLSNFMHHETNEDHVLILNEAAELSQSMSEAKRVLLAYAHYLLKTKEVPPALMPLLEYRNPSLSLSLVETFCRRVDPALYARLIEGSVVSQLPMVFVAAWGGEEIPEFKAFFREGRVILRNSRNPDLQIVLQALETIDKGNDPLTLLKECCKAPTYKEKLNRLALVTALYSLNRRPGAIDTLEIQVKEALEATGMISFKEVKDFATSYPLTFGSMRVANSLFIYASRLKNYITLAPFLSRFVTGVMNKTFKTDRYEEEGSPHLKKLAENHRALYTAWQEAPPPEALLESSFTIVDTDDWQDLMLCGTEVPESCQRIDGDPMLNRCLLAYLMDGKNRLLAIKNSSGRIEARTILRLLFDGDKPVLFQERIYTTNPDYAAVLLAFAKARATTLGLPLFREGAGKTLVSLGSLAPLEYVDADKKGLTNGCFTIQGDEIK